MTYMGDHPIYVAYIPAQVHVAAANTVHWDLFNADATVIVRVVSILQIPKIDAAVTGIWLNWLLERTTAVGTGGSAITPWLPDLSQTALDADVTCRSKPTGGATASTDLTDYWLNADETDVNAARLSADGGKELVPESLRPLKGGQGIVLRQNQGIRLVQVTSSDQGSTGWQIAFSAAA